MHFKKTTSGFTLLETIVAATMAATVMTGVFMTIGNVYFAQKKISVKQDFASESRFLMERTLRMIRDNTIDYDRFFVEVGPDVDDCGAFNVNQVPLPLQTDSDEAVALLNYNNNRTTRSAIGYKNIFVWNTTSSPVAAGTKKPDRSLGGLSLFDLDNNGFIDDPDPCAAAFPAKPLTSFFVINNARDTRYGLRFHDGALELQTQIGVDINNDGIFDTWGPEDVDGDGHYDDWEEGDVRIRWDAQCFLDTWNPEKHHYVSYRVDEGNISLDAQKYCLSAHDWTPISLTSLSVKDFWVIPSPVRDPFLAFRSKDDQQHPHVQVHLETALTNPQKYGFNTPPEFKLQTMVSSRVFGDTR